MIERVVSRGFRGRQGASPQAGRLPPGPDLTADFPVRSAGPAPRTPLDRWDFSIVGQVERPTRWTWEEVRALPRETITRDLHGVTRWSKLATTWTGTSGDTLLERVGTDARCVIACGDGGDPTNLPIADRTGGRAWIVSGYEGNPLAPEHGGPARLLVSHRSFWKSAKWVRGFRLVDHDEPGFGESLGSHPSGDPWKEQRSWAE
jgi:DMSO/TMAO reductase YedYZ molybdopterin-dependent catalytic subunit